MKKLFQQMIVVATAIATGATSCVPAGAPPDPRGAVGLAAVPSAATRGETFLTTDGWTVKIERLTLLAMITAVEANATKGEPAEGLFLWNGGARTELILRATRAGPRIVRTELQGEGTFTVEGAAPSFYTNMDVDPAIEARFRLAPDGLEDSEPGAFPPHVGVILAIRAEKAGRAITLDVSLVGRNSQIRQPVEVRGDAITFVELDVVAERFFIVDPETEATGLQEIADADRDGDGHVTGAELREMAVVRSNAGVTLLEWLTRQAAAILVPR